MPVRSSVGELTEALEKMLGEVFTSGCYQISYASERSVLEVTVTWKHYCSSARLYIGGWATDEGVWRQMAERVEGLKRDFIQSGFAREEIEVSSTQYFDLLRNPVARFGR